MNEARLVYEDVNGKEWGRIYTNLSYGRTFAAIKNFEVLNGNDDMKYTITYYKYDKRYGEIKTNLTGNEIITAIKEFEIKQKQEG